MEAAEQKGGTSGGYLRRLRLTTPAQQGVEALVRVLRVISNRLFGVSVGVPVLGWITINRQRLEG